MDPAEYLHIATFNAENFYLLLDQSYSREELETLGDEQYLAMNTSIYNPNKDRRKIAEIARIIAEQDFDLVGLCEIGGLETLTAFNRLYLDQAYDCFLHEENSRRGIYVGALVKRGRFSRVSAVNAAGNFSRNLLRLELGAGPYTLTVFVVHLKSQLGSDQGLEQRVREIENLSRLIKGQRCLLMGDFNGIAIPGEHQFEYEPLLNLPHRDVLEAVGLPTAQRRTHYYFSSDGPHFTQLDYIFCSDDIEVAQAEILEGEIPLNMQQRRTLPSDHLFVRALVKVPGMRWRVAPQTPNLPMESPAAETAAAEGWWQRLVAAWKRWRSHLWR